VREGKAAAGSIGHPNPNDLRSRASTQSAAAMDGWKGTDGWLGLHTGSIGTHQEYAAKSIGENGYCDGS